MANDPQHEMSLSDYFSDSDLYFFGQGKSIQCACIWGGYVWGERKQATRTHNIFVLIRKVLTQ